MRQFKQPVKANKAKAVIQIAQPCKGVETLSVKIIQSNQKSGVWFVQEKSLFNSRLQRK